jgi:ankyrin repeat protein
LDAALIAAAAKGNVDVVRILLGAGADPVWFDSAGDTALTVAVPTGNAALIGSLLANGAKADGIANGSGLTPLGLAARGGHADVADVLLLSGADVNTINQPCDNTALMLAACMGHVGVVSRLLQAGADSSLRNANRLAAADLAKEGRHSAIVEMLHHWDVNTV